jgi:CubicO group peptidase (beta-lactamase class C family)
MRSIRIAFVVVAVTALSAAEQDTARMEQVVQSHVAAGTFMGSVLVARDGAVVLDKAYGMANLELDVANTPDTKFRLGSITKQFTAAAILLLEERGQLTIDAPVKSYITGAPAAWDRVRVFNLLTHTAGIPNFTAFATYNEFKGTARSADSIVSLFKDRDLEFGPGEKYNYSNSGYVALGAIIEKVSGVSYEKFIQDHIFTPLGMTDSGYDSNTAIIKRRASGYIKTPAGYLNADYIHMSIPHAAGALYSTTRDLLKWQQALFAGRVVSKPSLDRMLTPFKNDYGLGVVSMTSNGRRVILHGGGIDGFNTQLSYYPDTRTTIAVLSNVNGPVPGVLAGQLGQLMHGETVTLTSERKEITLPAAALSKYVGVYQLTPAATITVTLNGSTLQTQLTGQGRLDIFPQSETLFFLRAVDAQLEFAADGSAVTLHQNGRSQKALRK